MTGSPKYLVGDRVQLHPATDLWMAGDRFGEVKAITWNNTDGYYKYVIHTDSSGRHVRIRESDILCHA